MQEIFPSFNPNLRLILVINDGTSSALKTLTVLLTEFLLSVLQ
jgi:hypothetical protein